MAIICFVASWLLLLFTRHAKAAPIPVHQLVVVNTSSSVIVRLRAFDDSNPNLSYTVDALPSTGKLFQLSQVYSDYGYLPIHGNPIVASGTIVTGSQSRISYTRPSPDKEVNREWDTIQFSAVSGTVESSRGLVKFVSSSGTLMGSDFLIDNEGWSIIGNKNPKDPASYESFTVGPGFSNYIFGTDDVINSNGAASDNSLWYFYAPSKFYGNFGLSYKGYLTFSMVAFSGDISTNNGMGVPFIILECSECPGPIKKGQRLVLPYSAIARTILDSSSSIKSFTVSLSETAGWLKDSQNALEPWSAVTQCDMIQVLSRLSGIYVLGDLTPWYETVALDNFRIFNFKGQLPLCALSMTDASICTC